MDALAEFRIGQADHDAGAHVGMRGDRGLDLGRIDVGAAAQDHVGEPVAEIEIAVGIEPADVAERFPAVGTSLRLGAEIMIGDARRRRWAGNRFRRSRPVATSLPSSPMIRSASRSPILPTEPLCASHSTPEMMVAPWRLGAAIEFVDSLRPEPLDPFFLQPGRHRSRHVKHDLKAGEIVAVAHCLRQRPDAMHHGRHEIDPLHAVGSIRRSVSSASNFTMPVTPPAGEQRQMRHDERRVVIERAGIEQRARRAASRAAVGRGIDHRRLVIEDHLGPPGRAAAGHRLPVARHRVRRSVRPKNLPA